MNLQAGLQFAIDGLSLGGTYALLALGMAIVFSIMGLVNFAHGELLTIAAYAALFLTLVVHVPLALVAPLTIGVAVVAALAMERVVFRPLRGASEATLLVASFALSVTIQNLFVVLVGARPKAIPLPDWTNAALNVGPYTVSLIQIVTTFACFACLGGLRLIFTRTTMGIAMRAASQDFVATRLMGIRANQMIATAFALSGFLAGVATLLYVARRGTVDPYMGLTPVVKAFIATVLGGLGNLSGAVVGGFTLGFLEVAFQAGLPPDVRPFRDAVVFGVVVGVLLFRPEGLLGRRQVR